MVARGEFMFKSVQTRDKGNFTDKSTGEVIVYKSCNVLICDEIMSDGKGKERKFKFPLENKALLNDFQGLNPYTRVILEFDVSIYTSNAKVEPIRIVEIK